MKNSVFSNISKKDYLPNNYQMCHCSSSSHFIPVRHHLSKYFKLSESPSTNSATPLSTECDLEKYGENESRNTLPFPRSYEKMNDNLAQLVYNRVADSRRRHGGITIFFNFSREKNSRVFLQKFQSTKERFQLPQFLARNLSAFLGG